MQRGKAREWVAWHIGEVCKAPMRRSAWLLASSYVREPGLPVRALTCPTPNHYSIIYYRSSLWESKHRSHVTLCDRSNEGGGSLSSSSLLLLLLPPPLPPQPLLPPSSPLSFSFTFRHSRDARHSRVRWPRFSCQTRHDDHPFRELRAGNKLRRQICVRERLAITQSPPAFGCSDRETHVNRDTRRVRNEQSITYDTMRRKYQIAKQPLLNENFKSTICNVPRQRYIFPNFIFDYNDFI